MSSVAFDQARRALWLFGAILAILYIAGAALLPFIVGTLIAWGLQPAQRTLLKTGIPRAVAATALTVCVVVALGAVFIFAVPAVVQVIDEMIDAVKASYPDIISGLEGLTGMSIEKPAEDVIDDLSDGNLEPLIEPATSATPLVVSLLGSALNAALLSLITPVVVFYLLLDWNVIHRAIDNWLPADTAAELNDIWDISKDRGLQYVWGRAVVVFWMSALHIIGLWLIGFDKFWLIGILAGFSVVIPIVGNIAVLGLAIVAGLLQSPDVGFLIAILAIFGVAQVLEMVWIEPHFLGHSMNLHPFLVLLVLMLGGHLLGPIGAVIALPIAAIAIGILEGSKQLQKRHAVSKEAQKLTTTSSSAA